MYRYDEYDQQIVNERVDQYRDQVRRRLSGELTEQEFLPLRLQNGLSWKIPPISWLSWHPLRCMLSKHPEIVCVILHRMNSQG